MTNKSSANIVFFRILAKLIDLIIVIILWKTFPNSGLFIGIFYLLISDGIFRGRSIGKKLLRLRVINTERNYHADFRDSIIRNLSIGAPLFFLIIPIIGWLICLFVIIIEFIITIGDKEQKRLGDFLAHTQVIED